MTTFKGAVVGADPARTGPRGRARCRKESDSAMVAGQKGADVKDKALLETVVLCFRRAGGGVFSLTQIFRPAGLRRRRFFCEAQIVCAQPGFRAKIR